MAGLNPPQLAAVKTLRGPLLVLAGAGTGKTRVVTYRIAELIRTGTPPSKILAVTFTNKAAAEMQERAKALLGKSPNKERPEISTFHSLCVRILRRHATALGYPATFKICDRGDQEGLARQVLREIRVPEASLRPGDLLFFVSQWKSKSIRPEAAARQAQTDKEHLASMAYRRYQKAIKLAGSVDFDDLLLCTEELFEKFPEIRRAESGRFAQVLIDEYQDTNRTQYQIVRALAQGHRNLCVVGDDDQSIYGWRGAEVTHILRFKQDWPDAKVVRLEDNYRSTEAILTLANRLIAFNRHRHEKTLKAARPGGEKPRVLQCQNEEDEAQQIITDIRGRLREPGVEPRDIAILFRTNEQPRAFEAELRRHQLPYVLIGGMSFYDRKEIRDVLSYLKVLVKPEDEIALLRIINYPPRGIGQKSVENLLKEAIASGRPLWQLLEDSHALSQQSSTTREGMIGLVRLVKKYQDRLHKEPLTAVVMDLLGEVRFREELAKQYPDPAEQLSRWEAVGQVLDALTAYSKRSAKPTLLGFLDDIATGQEDSNDNKEDQLNRNAIALMTLHSAKGLEFPHVYLVGMEEGLLPHHRSVTAEGDAIDEERRLCYVGITRAQDRLTLSLALSRMKWGKPRESLPSRFLFEITGQAEKASDIHHRAKRHVEKSKAPARRPPPRKNG